jgi:hypothetical protein
MIRSISNSGVFGFGPFRDVVISMRYRSGWAWDQAKSTSLTSGRSFRDACYPFALAILPTRGLVHGANFMVPIHRADS